jgi:nitrite reductase (NADH) large subunit
MARGRLLIIGNGMAGLRFLEELVERAPDRFGITALGAEPVAAYNRVLLTSLLAGAIGADDVRLRPDAWYAGHSIKLLKGQAALGLDVTGRRVVLRGGRSLPFDTLVLATRRDAGPGGPADASDDRRSPRRLE